MKKIESSYSRGRMWSMALLLSAVALVTAGCGGGGGRDAILGANVDALAAPVALAAPTVTLTVPAAGAIDVAINTKVTATFNKDMDPATIVTPVTTFTLAGPGATVVPGLVAYDVAARTATFKPTTPTGELLANTKYTATVTTGAKDLS